MRIVPWIAAAWASFSAGCVFHDDDGAHTFACSDGVCPSGEMCTPAKLCAPAPDKDAPIQTCANPEQLADVDTKSGSTIGRQNLLAPTCAGMKMVGPDSVFESTLPIGTHLKAVLYSQSPDARIYALPDCITLGPTCAGDVVGTNQIPLEMKVMFTPQYIVVDSTNAAEDIPFSFDFDHPPPAAASPASTRAP